jgi:hypothetical protein
MSLRITCVAANLVKTQHGRVARDGVADLYVFVRYFFDGPVIVEWPKYTTCVSPQRLWTETNAITQ